MRSVSHFTYHESTLEALWKEGAELQILFDPEWSEGRPTGYVDQWLLKRDLPAFQWCVFGDETWRPVLAVSRELRSYASYLRRPEQSEYYLKRWQKYLPLPLTTVLKTPLVGKVVKKALSTETLGESLRWLEDQLPPSNKVTAFLKKLKPDVLVASPVNMRFSGEVEYVKAAKALGIPTMLPVYSWDNLTTKGLIQVRPDTLLAWNETHREEAVRVHGVPPENIEVTGSPFFDKWFSQEPLEETAQRDFLRKVGLDPARPVVSYLGSSVNIARDETWLIRELAKALRESSHPKLKTTQLLVRPHPANFKKYAELNEPNVAIWPRPPFSFERGVPETEEAKQEFALALKVGFAVIGINTSAMLEAVIEGKPLLSFICREYESTQMKALHFQQLLEASVLYKVDSHESFLTCLAALLEGKDEKKKLRTAFVAKFVRPKGMKRSAGEIQAHAILKAVVQPVFS